MRGALPTGHRAYQHAPQINHRKAQWQLLNVAFDAGLRLVFDKHARGAQHVGVQFRLAGAVATDAVDVHSRLNHVGRQNRCVGFVGGNSGHDVGTANRVCRGRCATDCQGRIRTQVTHQFVSGRGINIEDADFFDTEQCVEGDRLKFALRAVADQRHRARVWAGQRPRCHERGGAGAKRGRQRQFGQQHRVARFNLGQRAESHHRRQAFGGVAGVAVDVFEGVVRGVRDWHQFDHAGSRMVGNTRRFFKVGPAHEVVSNLVG